MVAKMLAGSNNAYFLVVILCGPRVTSRVPARRTPRALPKEDMAYLPIVLLAFLAKNVCETLRSLSRSHLLPNRLPPNNNGSDWPEYDTDCSGSVNWLYGKGKF